MSEDATTTPEKEGTAAPAEVATQPEDASTEKSAEESSAASASTDREASEKKEEKKADEKGKPDQRDLRDHKDKRQRGGRGGRRGGGREREKKEFEESILRISRVTRVVKGGRRMRFQVTVAIGDKKGRVGLGVGKATEVMVGIQKAVAAAKKKLVTVPIFEDSIPHDIEAYFKATKVILIPAPEGTGVIAGGSVRTILDLAGIKNVLSKSHGSRNRLNTAYATFEALNLLRTEAPPSNKKKAEVESEEVKSQKSKVKSEKTTEEEKKAVKKKAPVKKESSSAKATEDKGKAKTTKKKEETGKKSKAKSKK